MSEFLRLKKSNCKNCYKCIRNCPVKAIKFSANQAHIAHEDCILCGQCFVVCPQNAKQIADSAETAKTLIMSGAPVYASVAPSFAANYAGSGIEDMREALKLLGFTDAEETAIGATYVKKEYERLLQASPHVLISSCCHSVNLLIQKHFPHGCLPYLADVMSPMQAHSIDIKRRTPKAKTVFIGPCVAKKDEAERYAGIVDTVLTFEELDAWLAEKNIHLKKTAKKNEHSRARLFPLAGGIIRSMDIDREKYSYIAVDGLDNCLDALKCIDAMRDGSSGAFKNCFVEMSACAGSCIGGPVIDKYRHTPIRDYIAVEKYAGGADFKTAPLDGLGKGFDVLIVDAKQPNEQEIAGILRNMGRTTEAEMLNCGFCGYDSCREKAIAVYQGKAEVSMCLPFLMEKSESFSDTIIDNTPNAILVLNEELQVQQINRAAVSMMNIKNAADVLGEHVVRILDPAPFQAVLTGASSQTKKNYLAEYGKYVEQNVIYNWEYKVIICMMRDVTTEENLRKEKMAAGLNTIEIADEVVHKQMRVVQEIAYLLGETAAETKIVLTKLKESIKQHE